MYSLVKNLYKYSGKKEFNDNLVNFIFREAEDDSSKYKSPYVKTPKNCTAIKNRAFKNNFFLKHILLSDDIETIYPNAFNDCSNLEKIILPKNVKFIGKLAFTDCNSLEVIIIPNSVQDIEYGAFNSCKNFISSNFTKWFS